MQTIRRRALKALFMLLFPVAATAFIVADSALAASVRRAANPLPTIDRLSPLSETDKERSHQTGCNFVFGRADRYYLQLIGDELMFRTPDGLHICRIANGDGFTEEKTVAVCDGISFKLHSTGRMTQYEASDSSSAPARLLIGQARASHILRGHWLRGHWAVAC